MNTKTIVSPGPASQPRGGERTALFDWWRELVESYLPKLKHLELKVQLVLLRHADNATGECWPSLPTIMRLTGCRNATRTTRAIKGLELKGLVRTVQVGGGRKSTIRQLQFPQSQSDARRPQTADAPAPSSSDSAEKILSQPDTPAGTPSDTAPLSQPDTRTTHVTAQPTAPIELPIKLSSHRDVAMTSPMNVSESVPAIEGTETFPEYFEQKFRERYGKAYPWRKQDRRIVLEIITALGAEFDWRRVIDAYFASKDKFYAGHELRKLNLDLAKVLAAASGGPEILRSGASLERGRWQPSASDLERGRGN